MDTFEFTERPVSITVSEDRKRVTITYSNNMWDEISSNTPLEDNIITKLRRFVTASREAKRIETDDTEFTMREALETVRDAGGTVLGVLARRNGQDYVVRPDGTIRKITITVE